MELVELEIGIIIILMEIRMLKVIEIIVEFATFNVEETEVYHISVMGIETSKDVRAAVDSLE